DSRLAADGAGGAAAGHAAGQRKCADGGGGQDASHVAAAPDSRPLHAGADAARHAAEPPLAAKACGAGAAQGGCWEGAPCVPHAAVVAVIAAVEPRAGAHKAGALNVDDVERGRAGAEQVGGGRARAAPARVDRAGPPDGLDHRAARGHARVAHRRRRGRPAPRDRRGGGHAAAQQRRVARRRRRRGPAVGRRDRPAANRRAAGPHWHRLSPCVGGDKLGPGRPGARAQAVGRENCWRPVAAPSGGPEPAAGAHGVVAGKEPQTAGAAGPHAVGHSAQAGAAHAGEQLEHLERGIANVDQEWRTAGARGKRQAGGRGAAQVRGGAAQDAQRRCE
ncbi:hypothetical protein IWQ56_007414, partial [Coemansia nantahalensis]